MKNPALFLLLPFALVLASACSDRTASEESVKQIYSVRGMVRDLPNPEQPGSEFSVHHEAIDDFVSVQGDVVGMSAMTMPFPLSEGINLEGIAVGDPVEITLKIDWNGDLPVEVTAVRELPAGTALEFRKAKPPAQSQ